MTANELIAQGYRRVSNKYREISRIDRVDWKEYMASQHAPWDLEQGRSWVECLSKTPGNAEDQYRRCYSKDCITVSREVFQRIPGSTWDPVGYIPKEEALDAQP